MSRFNFCGPSYTSESPNAADQTSMNWYPESTENEGQSPIVMCPTPGQEVFCDTDETPIRGEIIVTHRVFTVAGSKFFEIMSDGTKFLWGTLVNDSKLVSMAAGTSQILIASAGSPYVFDFTTNTFTALPNGTLLGAISFVGYADGEFVALLKDSNQFQWSKLLDATTWDPLDTQKVSVFTGNVLSMLVDHRELWFWGENKTQVYADVGAPDVFAVVPGGFIEAGIFAPQSPVRLDNSIFWLGGDERGAGVIWRANGYTPQRVSNHAVEFALQGYLTRYGTMGLQDAVGYSYQDQGHSFYVLYFPTANKTWVFDVATGMWHERGYWNATNAVFTAHRSQCHTFAFGKHLVGDWASGKIYNMSIALYSDAGNLIRRVRRAPHISKEQQRAFHHQLQVFLESGLGPIPPLFAPLVPPTSVVLRDSLGGLWSVQVTDSGILETTAVTTGYADDVLLNDITLPVTTWRLGVTAGGLLTTDLIAYRLEPSALYLGTSPSAFDWRLQITGGLLQTSPGSSPTGDPSGRDPVLNLRWSDDSGHAWSNERSVGVGKAGEYRKRAMFRRLGKSRDRIYEVNVSDPIPWRLVDSFLQVSQ